MSRAFFLYHADNLAIDKDRPSACPTLGVGSMTMKGVM